MDLDATDAEYVVTRIEDGLMMSEPILFLTSNGGVVEMEDDCEEQRCFNFIDLEMNIAFQF